MELFSVGTRFGIKMVRVSMFIVDTEHGVFLDIRRVSY